MPWQPMVDPSTDHEIKPFFFFHSSVTPRGSSFYSIWWLLLSQDDQWGPGRMLFGAAVINCQTFVFNDNCQPCTVAPQSMDTWRHSWNNKSPKSLLFQCNHWPSLIYYQISLISITPITSNQDSVCLGPWNWRKHQEVDGAAVSLNSKQKTIIWTISSRTCWFTIGNWPGEFKALIYHWLIIPTYLSYSSKADSGFSHIA